MAQRRIVSAMVLKFRDLAAMNQLPADTIPLVDRGEVYGIGVLYTPDGKSRIDVIEMAFNWRVCVTDLPLALGYGRYWCFPKSMTAEEVVAAVRAWGGGADSEPDGWIKSWDQRVGGWIAEEHLRRMGERAEKLPIVSRHQAGKAAP